jgi:phosphate transport system substrate-binding protein
MTPRPRTPSLLLLLAVLLLAAAGCGGGREGAARDGDGGAAAAGASDLELSGRITADGSSTVGPFTTAAAERFQRQHSDVQITVGISGTGGGFSRFCRGETDLSNASREMKEEEAEECEAGGVEYVQFRIVNDGIAVVVNPENDWAQCLTTDELRRIWTPESQIRNWRQVRDGFPDVPLTLAGPGTDSGTFDYFTEEINGEAGASRSDFTASEDDNVIVQAVAGNRGGLGYFGLSYLEENEGRLKGIGVDGGDGCVEPGVDTVQDATYSPLGRPLYLYATKDAIARDEVQELIRMMIDQNEPIASAALYVPLTRGQREDAREALQGAIEEGES